MAWGRRKLPDRIDASSAIGEAADAGSARPVADGGTGWPSGEPGWNGSRSGVRPKSASMLSVSWVGSEPSAVPRRAGWGSDPSAAPSPRPSGSRAEAACDRSRASASGGAGNASNGSNPSGIDGSDPAPAARASPGGIRSANGSSGTPAGAPARPGDSGSANGSGIPNGSPAPLAGRSASASTDNSYSATTIRSPCASRRHSPCRRAWPLTRSAFASLRQVIVAVAPETSTRAC